MSGDWVGLSPRFTPGWPWPEDSYGLTPMYGDDGWCRGCGTPLVDQVGSLVVQGRKFPTADAWTPNWRFDVLCISAGLAGELAARFELDLRDVHQPSSGPTGVQQLVPRRSDDPWYRPEDLARAVEARHGDLVADRSGRTCRTCELWKWLPVAVGDVPVRAGALESGADVVASPESFGDGLASFHHLLFRRELAEALLASTPRNWRLVEVTAA